MMKELTLKEIQGIGLDILKDVHEFCCNNKILNIGHSNFKCPSLLIFVVRFQIKLIARGRVKRKC